MADRAEIDWAGRWREIQQARTRQQAQLRAREGDYWGGRADVFARRIGAPDAAMQLLSARLKPGDTLLDVGAGAGRYAIPAASLAKEVIALEPSAGMGQALLAEADKRGVNNLRLIQSDWLSADAPEADVVFCAHVLYFTPEAAEFVRKLNAHARRECMIVHRVDQAGAGHADLYREIRGESQAPEPSFIDLYNLLYALGIVADVAIVAGMNSMSRFESIDQAEASVTSAIAPPDDASRARIRPYLESRLIQGPDGSFTFRGALNRIAVISWTKS